MEIGKTLWSMALGAALALPAAALERPEWRGGLLMGYVYGQNGNPWPGLDDPLHNAGRGGFFISQARVQSQLRFDSTLIGVFTGNVIGLDPQELYLQKAWGDYRVKFGKFRGAGLKSGSGTDEFDLTTAQRPRYARLWNSYKRLHNFRDFGIQGERDYFDGRFKNRLFFHNANGENVFNDEPAFPSGPSTQALGLDYAADLRVSAFNQVGGHVGALAYQEWDEFVGGHDFWEAQYWFKSNPIVDASLNHQMDFPRFHMQNEAMALWNRRMPNPDGSSMLTWGASTLARFDHTPRWSPFVGYEYVDNSDGRFPDDALQLIKIGTLFRPSPAGYPGMRLTAQYLRALEEGGENLLANDILYVHFQSVF